MCAFFHTVSVFWNQKESDEMNYVRHNSPLPSPLCFGIKIESKTVNVWIWQVPQPSNGDAFRSKRRSDQHKQNLDMGRAGYSTYWLSAALCLECMVVLFG